MSYRSDGGRIPRLRDVRSQARNVSLPMITAQSKPLGSSTPLSSRPQIPRLINLSSRSRRAVSMSEAEEIRPVVAQSNPSPSLDITRPFVSPQAPIHAIPFQSSLDTTTDLPQTLKTPITPILLQSSPSVDSHLPLQSRPRNVLRRKAPTIGQHTEKNKVQTESIRPSGLNVIIPNNTAATYTEPVPFHSSSRTELVRKTPSPMVTDQFAKASLEKHVHHGPKELASLRTTINTHNLPPPTPVFPSASTPSTRYSGSPGVWSRTSTPASLSSCSPGIVQPAKVGPRFRQPSPSHTGLLVFSPQIQKPSQKGGRVAGRSPHLARGMGSTTSLASESREETEVKSDLARSPSPPNSLLPRRASIRSGLPRQAKASPVASQSREKVNTKPLTGTGVSMGTRSHPNPSVQIPMRPSREGTDQLELEPSPVVRTNISPRAVRAHKRHGSGESSIAPASNQSAAASVDSLHSLASSRAQIRTPTSPEMTRKSPRTLTEPPNIMPTDSSPEKSRRFGLFSKKSKPELNTRQNEARTARKGPAAGTGHEGYGKYAQRGRKSSISSNSDTRGRSTSTTRSGPKSVASSKGSSRSRPDMELDDFLLERLEPVYINGGGMRSEILSRTQSEQSMSALSTKSAPGSTQDSKMLQPSGYINKTSTGPTGKPRDSRESHRRDLSSPATISSTASQSKIPNIGGVEKPKVRSEANASTRSLPQLNIPSTSARHVGSQPKMKKPSKKGLNLKWPFFQKDSRVVLPISSEPAPAPQLAAKVAPVSVRRPVAHYALVDTDSDPLEDIFHNLEDSPPTEEEELILTAEVPERLDIRKTTQSILLPSPPKLHNEFRDDRPASPKVYFQKEPTSGPETNVEKQRPSRLASVGRIPRVVSRRDRQHKPAFQSFSRPFSVAESPSLLAPVTDLSHRQIPSSHPDKQRSEPGNFGFDLTMPFGDPMKGSVLDFLAGPYAKHEFLAFSPRKDSMFSTSSGSESLAAITAVIPTPEMDLTEDEIWGEYDEFIDHVLSPETPNLPLSRELGSEKFEMATMATRALQAGLNGETGRPNLPPILIEQPTVALTPASPPNSGNSIHLRRSKIVTALRTSLSPTSQPSVSDMMARYRQDQDVGISDSKGYGDIPAPTISVEPTPSSFLNSPSLNPSPSFESCRQRNTIMFDIAERDREGPTAQTNIRSGSLMTSRWLSFGRVLFSPAHNHIKNGEQERILVVDGLGNDDWSFYCALTYPNADVYCLHEGPSPTASKHPAAWQPPTNHHTIHHASLEDPVPFPKAFFTVTVLRFPAACSEKAQDNIVSECKRVLRAGGYMEMSIIDLDMVNMGIRTRKAVRKLKETMYLSDGNISLKPASDSIQKLLGRYGFDSLRRCIVQIPVAGIIVRSSASSSSTSSSNPSTLTAAVMSSTALSAACGSSTGLRSKVHGKSTSNETDLSLGDLLSDPSPSPSNDESIRKIVARVGRWWYTRVYECPVLPNGDVDRSIWADRKVIRECQQRGTGFRLLIAYTQKPSEKRRTASV
ncbi:hypothetical protein P175DRAFT_0497687 [Aspergillus ochraceoroseus IBT 24754]|uniref:Methyltransferase type 11 domain-containing protein n=2 Tax=Aspergillus ochraceoroseus TaxID=138278 RepID=A0A2T5M7Q8_9EURO|nr:uncharacterized protein P175DRAFT_0497687 [Aspergillus ochraceoroseus IBT 24754]PTU24569.1 hypothetical protein P175DRAFT_0497687 [Aspergillus ochraceoroseus IBT 24754]